MAGVHQEGAGSGHFAALLVYPGRVGLRPSREEREGVGGWRPYRPADEIERRIAGSAFLLHTQSPTRSQVSAVDRREVLQRR